MRLNLVILPIEDELIKIENILTESVIETEDGLYRFQFAKPVNRAGDVVFTDCNSEEEFNTVYSLILKEGICYVRLNLNHLPIDQKYYQSVSSGILEMPFEGFITFLQEQF